MFGRRDKETRRLPLRRKVLFRKPGRDDQDVGFTSNVSLFGMFVETSRPHRPGVHLELEVEDQGRTYVLMATVRHSRLVHAADAADPGSGMGLEFDRPVQIFAPRKSDVSTAQPASRTQTSGSRVLWRRR